MFTHVPGIKVVVPSCAYDAKGLLIQSIRDDDPVIYMEHKNLYDVTQEVPDESYTIPFGEANFTREGKDITFIGMGQTVGICNKVADKLKNEGSGTSSQTNVRPIDGSVRTYIMPSNFKRDKPRYGDASGVRGAARLGRSATY